MKDWRLIYIIFAKSEDKLYISNKNRQAYFVLLSVCIIFVRINLKNCNVMFDKETYVQRRALLKKNIGSGVLLFLGNDEQGLNYEDNAFRYRLSSTISACRLPDFPLSLTSMRTKKSFSETN